MLKMALAKRTGPGRGWLLWPHKDKIVAANGLQRRQKVPRFPKPEQREGGRV
jgi:hypothetical protein